MEMFDIETHKADEPVVILNFQDLFGRRPESHELLDAWMMYTIIKGKLLKSNSHYNGSLQIKDGTFSVSEVASPSNITGVISCIGLTAVSDKNIFSAHFLDPSAPSLRSKYGINPTGQTLIDIVDNYVSFFQNLVGKDFPREIVINSKTGPTQPYWDLMMSRLEQKFINTDFRFVDSTEYKHSF